MKEKISVKSIQKEILSIDLKKRLNRVLFGFGSYVISHQQFSVDSVVR